MPTLTVKVVDERIPVKPKDWSSAIVKDGLKFKPSNLTNSFILPKSWFDEVVISNSPEVLLYAAVLIAYELPVVAIPTIPTIEPLPFVVAFTFAPTKFATPNPPVEPSDTITPPLGNWFWFTSVSLIINVPLSDVIPVNTTFVAVAPTPAKL